MRKVQLMISVLLLVLLLVACAPKVTPTPVPQIPAKTAPLPAPAKVAPPAPTSTATPAVVAPAQPTWEARWEGLMEGAKKEGRLVLYTTLGGTERQRMVSAFESKYGVRVEAITGLSSQNTEKIAAQRRAGLYQVDVWLSGSSTLVAIKSKGAVDRLEPALLLPELTEPEVVKKTWYFGELSWVDKDRTMVVGLMDLKEPVSINTNLVKPGEITAYRDLLDPKWKGKMSLQDPTTAGGGEQWFAAVLEMGAVDANFMRELAKQELAITRDRRLQVEWLAHGKQAIAIAPYTPAVTEFIRVGAPVMRFRIEPSYLAGSTSGISLLNRAPHPDAARLFINWLLSKEGQMAHSQAVGAQGQRLDVPTGHLEPSRVLAPGLKAFRTDNEEFMLKQTGSYSNLSKEILGPLLGR